MKNEGEGKKHHDYNKNGGGSGGATWRKVRHGGGRPSWWQLSEYLSSHCVTSIHYVSTERI